MSPSGFEPCIYQRSISWYLALWYQETFHYQQVDPAFGAHKLQKVRIGNAISMTSLSACCTRRVGETRGPSRCVPQERDRAIGTIPRAHPVHAHRWNRCGRRCRPRARTSSDLAAPAHRWRCRFPCRRRLWRHHQVWCVSLSLAARYSASMPARAGSCIRCPRRVAALR